SMAQPPGWRRPASRRLKHGSRAPELIEIKSAAAWAYSVARCCGRVRTRVFCRRRPRGRARVLLGPRAAASPPPVRGCPMAEPHPTAVHHMPSFITAPGDTDVLMVVMVFVLLVSVVAFGVLFFRLHTLPERIAHKSHKIQFEIVAVLGLISLFTHMHI